MERGKYEIAKEGRFLLFVGDLSVTSESTLDLEEDDSDEDHAALRLKKDVLKFVRVYFGGFVRWHASFEWNQRIRRRSGMGKVKSEASEPEIKVKFGDIVSDALKLLFRQPGIMARGAERGLKIPRVKISPKSEVTKMDIDLIARSCFKLVPRVVGVLIRLEGQILHNSFEASLARGLTFFDPDSLHATTCMMRATSFRLPLGVTLYDLYLPEVTANSPLRPSGSNANFQRSASAGALDEFDDGDDSHTSESEVNSSGSEEQEYGRSPPEVTPLVMKRRSVRNREERRDKILEAKSKEKDFLTNSMRRIVRSAHPGKIDRKVGVMNEEVTEGSKDLVLFLQTVGSIDLMVGIQSGTIEEGMIRSLWDLGLIKLPGLRSTLLA